MSRVQESVKSEGLAWMNIFFADYWYFERMTKVVFSEGFSCDIVLGAD